ncbi:MAG TPA: MaoC family dehydratase [Planctomycetaceae bacterium]|nr:MaoC family dehydratase [Planctomycetaceae bacterium]
MPSATQQALERLTALKGKESPPGAWHTVTQEQIDAFARTTLDDQFIHTDAVRAARESPFGTTIAHGFLTLSLASHLVTSIPRPSPDPYEGRAVAINYGLDRVRFPMPVRVNSRIRARQSLASVEQKDERTLQLVHHITIEIEGETKPACVADYVTRAIFAS